MTIKAQTQTGNTPADPATAEPATDISVDPEPGEGDVVIQEVAPKPKVITVPTKAMKGIKDKARQEGRDLFQRELDGQAQQLGYENHAAWVEASRAARAASSTPSTTSTTSQQPKPETTTNVPAATAGDDPRIAELTRENQRLSGELNQAIQDKKRSNRQFAKAKRMLDKQQDQLLAQQGESELKLEAKDAGVEDVDYAVTVFQRSISGMSEEELKTVDTKKFFTEQLRQSHPHLYKPVEKPITTGTKNQSQVTPPNTSGPGAAPAPGQGGAVTDARLLSTEDFHKKLRGMGLSIPGAGGAVG